MKKLMKMVLSAWCLVLGASAEWTPVSTNTVEVPAPGEQGFFIVSPLFYVPGSDYTITGGVEDPFKHRRTR